jgi:hypothetical protein
MAGDAVDIVRLVGGDPRATVLRVPRVRRIANNHEDFLILDALGFLRLRRDCRQDAWNGIWLDRFKRIGEVDFQPVLTEQWVTFVFQILRYSEHKAAAPLVQLTPQSGQPMFSKMRRIGRQHPFAPLIAVAFGQR